MDNCGYYCFNQAVVLDVVSRLTYEYETLVLFLTNGVLSFRIQDGQLWILLLQPGRRPRCGVQAHVRIRDTRAFSHEWGTVVMQPTHMQIEIRPVPTGHHWDLEPRVVRLLRCSVLSAIPTNFVVQLNFVFFS